MRRKGRKGEGVGEVVGGMRNEEGIQEGKNLPDFSGAGGAVDL